MRFAGTWTCAARTLAPVQSPPASSWPSSVVQSLAFPALATLSQSDCDPPFRVGQHAASDAQPALASITCASVTEASGRSEDGPPSTQ
jgi:hypothetical protein